jgi:hypothetical protein
MDELEKHIMNTRASMDIHEPDPGLWSRIERGLQGKQRQLRSYLWRAAVIIIIAGAGLILTFRTIQSPVMNNQPEMKIVKETDIYYNTLIRTLYEEAEPLLTANPEVSYELTSGMNELDSLAMEIREDLHDQVANREVIEALIHNYRLRIELLEDMLAVMREAEANNNKTEIHEL